MAIEVFNRYEHKYLLEGETYETILRKLDQTMVIDSHNKNHEPYPIANLYFDTPEDSLIRTSLSRPIYKEKLRLRSYGVPREDTMVYLEIKKKFKGLVNKRRSKLKLEEAYSFLSSGKAPKSKDYMNPQVLLELEYFLHLYDLAPKLYLAYDRVAYFEKDNRDLRISFDQNIRTRRYDLALEKGDYGQRLLPETTVLMEIKTSLAKPLWLSHLLDELQLKRTRFSKYGTEFKHRLTCTENPYPIPESKEVIKNGSLV